MSEVALPVPVISQASRPYWEAAKEGRLDLLRCGGCGELVHFPRLACPSCWSRDLTLETVSGNGTIFSFSVVEHPMGALPSFVSRIPYVVVLVELDEGPKIVANLVNGAPEMGARVRLAEFETRGEFSLPQFEIASKRVGSTTEVDHSR